MPVLRPVALMADFADSCFYGREHLYPDGVPTSRQSSFYYAAHDSVYYDHLLTDVRDFFVAASGGRFDLDFDLRAEVPLLEQPMGYYGNHPDEFRDEPPLGMCGTIWIKGIKRDYVLR